MKIEGKQCRHGNMFKHLLTVGLLGLSAGFWVAGSGEVNADGRGTSASAASSANVEDAAAGEGGISSVPLNDNKIESKTLFKLMDSAETGIKFVNPIDKTHPKKYLFASSMGCGGVSLNDVNGDGLVDVYFTGGPVGNRLYIQKGDMKFEDVTKKAGVDGAGRWGVGAALVDVDNDGDVDIYVTNYTEKNQLYINEGGLKFTEQAEKFGLDVVDASHTPAFCDYDRDGDMDLYLMTNRWYRPEGFPQERAMVMRNGRAVVIDKYEKFYAPVDIGGGKYRMDVVGRPDRLLRNEGGKKFEDVSFDSGIKSRGHGLSATWFDYNADGWPDLFVGNDFNEPDQFYRNNGDGTFTDITLEALPHTSWFSMGADFGDFNNDLRLDFSIADMFGTTHYKQKTQMGSMGANYYMMQHWRPQQQMRNHFYVNTGTYRFAEAGFMAHIAKSDWSWAMKARDYDSDGQLDLFVSNGMSRNYNEKDKPELAMVPGKTQWDVFENEPALKERNMAFKNKGEINFTTVSKAWGLDHEGMSYAAATGDLNGDGHLDLIVCNLDEEVHVYLNKGNEKNRVMVQLKGTVGNTQGFGAKVYISAGGKKQVREMTLMRGYLSGDDPKMHFGLGEADKIESMRVEWASGHTQVFSDLKANQLYTVTEPGGKVEAVTRTPEKVDALYTELISGKTGIGAQHQEVYFDDFKRQLLLPNQHSQLGPGIAWGDADGDGDMDLFIGNAKDKASWLYLNQGSGKFEWTYSRSLGMDKKHEDMGALWFDADGDRDMDLYVVSGSVECEPGDEILRDRLYLNDGKAGFTRAEGALPDIRESGSVVAGCDYDRDGDIDLFVGGRVVPGKYPLTPNSQLLNNDGGKFSEVSDKDAEGLKQVGLVTSAVWTDVDADGWVDLAVAVEWGPVKIFKNQQGKLVDMTKAAGLEGMHGWWNGLTSGDLDGDGDMDFVVTNFGLNTKYHADKKHPAILYYGDFHGTGKYTLVEAEYEGQTLFPVRGKSCSSNAHGFLKKKFKTYHDFALAAVEDIYSPEKLKKANKYTCHELESGMLINNGKGQFKFTALPRMAQTAPGFGAVVTDANADGHADIVLAQNFFTPQIETGVMGGGVGTVIIGDGKLGFTPLRADHSGVMIPRDAKALTLCDVNQDGTQDLVVTNNDGPIQVFKQNAQTDQLVRISLKGKKGNLHAVGSRIVVELKDGRKRAFEVTAGGGYLSQSEPMVNMFTGGSGVVRITVTWPDGKTSTKDNVNPGYLTLSQP